jgi:hypothetical protein
MLAGSGVSKESNEFHQKLVRECWVSSDASLGVADFIIYLLESKMLARE